MADRLANPMSMQFSWWRVRSGESGKSSPLRFAAAYSRGPRRLDLPYQTKATSFVDGARNNPLSRLMRILFGGLFPMTRKERHFVVAVGVGVLVIGIAAISLSNGSGKSFEEGLKKAQVAAEEERGQKESAERSWREKVFAEVPRTAA